jgi:hypothetical protein
MTGFKPMKDNFNGIKPTPAAMTAPSALAHSPAGGLRISAVNLAKFMQAHMNGGIYNHTRILKAATADIMHNMQWFGYGLGGFYKQKGLNFHITDDLIPGRRLVGHSGEAYGLSGDAYFDPAGKVGVVFLMNGARLTDAAPFYSVETAIAKTLFTTFSPKSNKKTKKLSTKANANYITVDDRKIFLQAPVSLIKSGKTSQLFLPVMAAADALSTSIEQADDTVIFTLGQNKASLTAGQALMNVNGQPVVLPQAPYKQNGQIQVPVRELAAALKIKIKFSFS